MFVMLETVIEKDITGQVLNDMVEGIEEEMVMGTKKSRAAAAGVADLMKSLKPRKKGLQKGNKQLKVGDLTSGG